MALKVEPKLQIVSNLVRTWYLNSNQNFDEYTFGVEPSEYEIKLSAVYFSHVSAS